MSTRLSVNIDHNTLVKMLGGVSEAEVSLRAGIVTEFAKMYLKPLVTEAAMMSAKHAVLNEVSEELRQYFSTEKTNDRWGPATRDVLTPAMKALVKDSVSCAVQSELRKLVDDATAFEVRQLTPNIAKYVKDRINSAIVAEVHEQVNKKMGKVKAALETE